MMGNSRIGSITSTTSEFVAVTFDDGPDPAHTARVLEVLRRREATATFFVLLTRVRQHPELVDQILDGGHEVGLHGPDHLALTDFSHREAFARTVLAKQELEEALRGPVQWFRPPYGSQSISTLVATARAGLTSVLWTATTWDWKDVSPAERRAKAREGGRPGAILLAHDGTAGRADGADDGPPVECDRADLMDDVLEDYAVRGLLGRSVGETLAAGQAVRTLRTTRKRR